MEQPKITEEEYQLLLARLRQKNAIVKEQRELLDLALDAAHIGSWSWDTEKDYLVWDERMCKLFDADFDEKKDIDTFLTRVASFDQERVKEALAACINEGDFYELTYTIIWPSDKSKHFIHARGYLKRGKLSGICFNVVAPQ